MSTFPVIVIGAGQAGLSAAWHLRRKGLRPYLDFLVLDANARPGGAWQHRWEELRLGDAHGIHPLPGLPLSDPDPSRPAAEVVSEYYADYERRFELPVLHGVPVRSVTRSVDGGFELHTDTRNYTAVSLINATGTWDRPFWPSYPGHFAGRQLHTHDFVSSTEFTGQRVLVVGGGASATQFILSLRDAGAQTILSTRRPLDWREFTGQWGLRVEADVRARTRRGLPAGSVVSHTGLALTGPMRQAIDAGWMDSRGRIDHFDADGVYFADGSYEPLDAVLWATGFRPALEHLKELHLRTEHGGIAVDTVQAFEAPGLYFVGYGASASTLGATRAGRQAALAAFAQLRDGGLLPDDPHTPYGERLAVPAGVGD
ncbi:FAD-dependent oxidoreductase [Glutamicibacter sp. PS]|uniref:FAD-dependent oxidoreductase n=1 Tax=Glutamicibacter sp. PS TaxID=3075634 RepID=UPI002848EBE3|nr:FAD-dependent oxidoreductase [Glutamicibacter sp. PS]MDR4533722.1 NAD(P)/FAD-dependent oxidoreductase [Glutamicibacter sp. PS]